MTNIEQVPAPDWSSWLDEHGGAVLDVRLPGEWAQGTLPGALRISLQDLPASLDRLDPTTPLLLICRSGNRSNVAARFLADRGFVRVANAAGGMRAIGAAV